MSQPAGDKPQEVFDLSRDPVKHYVRIHGWVNMARQRLTKLRNMGIQREYGLRYFSLCGKDGIDIFLFKREELIQDDGRGFPSVFYCELYYANFAEVKPMLGRTQGARRTFEDLVHQRWFKDRVKKYPFDVVNLDFSGSCFPWQDHPFSRTLKAIYSLIALQKGYAFDLFVTFKALRSAENEEAIQELVANMERNFDQLNGVEERFRVRFNVSPRELREGDYGQFLLATFPKIIFGFGSNQGFRVGCPQKFLYRRSPPSPKPAYQIVKFLFSLEPVDVGQSFSVESRRLEVLTRSYQEAILTDLGTTPIDVDREFQDNPQLDEQLRNDCASVIASRKPFGL